MVITRPAPRCFLDPLQSACSFNVARKKKVPPAYTFLLLIKSHQYDLYRGDARDLSSRLFH